MIYEGGKRLVRCCPYQSNKQKSSTYSWYKCSSLTNNIDWLQVSHEGKGKYSTELWSDEAVQTIQELANSTQPWFLQVYTLFIMMVMLHLLRNWTLHSKPRQLFSAQSFSSLSGVCCDFWFLIRSRRWGEVGESIDFFDSGPRGRPWPRYAPHGMATQTPKRSVYTLRLCTENATKTQRIVVCVAIPKGGTTQCKQIAMV